jgi:uncharacterized protein involved in exopolysaccharide biosynthesis
MEQSYQPFDYSSARDVLTILFKHKFKILVVFLAIFIGATILSFQTHPLYEAKSVILVKFGREFLQRPEAGAGEGASVGPETIIRGEMSILTSRDLMNHVAKVVGPENLYPTSGKMPPNTTLEQAAAKLLEEDVRVASIGGTLIQITFVHPRPDVAATAVNTLVDAFKDRHLEVFGGKSTGFLENQAKAFQERLRESEGNLAGFKQRNQVFSFEEQKTILIQQRATLDASLKIAQNQISELEARIAWIRGPNWSFEKLPEARTEPSTLPQQLSALQQQLTTLQQKEGESLLKYTESSAVVQSLRQEIRAVRDAIRKNYDEARVDLQKAREEQRQIELRKAEGEMSVVRARVDSLRRQFVQVESGIRDLDMRGRELQDLKREASQEEENYRTYARKLEESLIIDDMDRRKMVAISVIEKAVPSPMPMKQKLGKRRMIAAGFFGGIVAGIVLALLLEFMAQGMTTPMSAEKRLGLPVMVAITKKC